jgi:hypothetical protein
MMRAALYLSLTLLPFYFCLFTLAFGQCGRSERATRPMPPARRTSMTIVLKRLVGWK